MHKDIAESWVDALRSGVYKQIRGRLRRRGGDDNSFSALGILCDMSRLGRWLDTDYEAGGIRARTLLPPEVKEWAGMRSNYGARIEGPSIFDLGEDKSIAFWQIADIIEKEWEEL